jgi:predicted transcriptional regulator
VVLKYFNPIYQENTIREMTIREVAEIIEGRVICCEDRVSTSVEYAFSSDLMSDVLTIEKENLLLITGLANLQTIRTSEMSDISCIIFARDKKIGEEMISLARENNMILVESPHSVFHISGELYKAGIKSIY